MGSYGGSDARFGFRVFHEERVRRLPFFFLSLLKIHIFNHVPGTSSDEVEVVMFDSRIPESRVLIVVFIVSSEVIHRISTSSLWTAARMAHT